MARLPRLHGQPKSHDKMPRWLRPKLSKSQQIDLGLNHLMNIDTVIHGRATEELLWEMVGGVLTWYSVATMLRLGEPEMLEQVKLMEAVLLRYGRTGGIGFTGPEYRLATDGAAQMDMLAAQVDQLSAITAAEWSERKLAELAAQFAQRDSISTDQRSEVAA